MVERRVSLKRSPLPRGSPVVVVTGGAGFIGSNLVCRLLEKKHDVVVLDIASKPVNLPRSGRLVYRQTDAYRADTLLSPAMRRASIVHLAAETSVRRSVSNPKLTIQANIGVTCALLEFARKVDAERFVFASSAAVYGNRRGACHEDDPPDPCSPYAASKLASEYYCRVYVKLYGVPVTILRYFNVYGPGHSERYAGVITRFVEEVLHGKPPIIYGDGKQTRDFIFIDDVSEATIRTLSTRARGGTIMNVGTGRAIRIRALAKKVLRHLNRQDLHPRFAPPRAGDIIYSKADILSARRQIGFSPQYDLDRGLDLTIKWLRQSKGL